MLILSIETSCDETAISLVKATGGFPHATYEILGDALWSQIDIHREYGGVFPALAKREHAATIVPMLEKALAESELEPHGSTPTLDPETADKVHRLLEREIGLADQLLSFHHTHGIYAIDLIAVTSGPGLEPALWVGVNFAKALALLWDTPVIPVNHMEGHILASVFDIDRDDQLSDINFPAISLLISGGHTELILMSDWGQYEKIGQTRDDAVGEAFDKVARLIGLPYPGGPEISKLAKKEREKNPDTKNVFKLPRPMLHTHDFDFSFSGLKTAVLYAIKKIEKLDDKAKSIIAREFEDAVVDVLLLKTKKAQKKYNAKSIIIGGGVSANEEIKKAFKKWTEENNELKIFLPEKELSTDNAVMIAIAGYMHLALETTQNKKDFVADGNQTEFVFPFLSAVATAHLE
jgi:N6-L-threonylcarbamoyladenine synthase